MTWRAGTDGRERPTLGAGIGFASGKLRERGVRRTYTLGSTGLTKESETSFDTAAGRRLVLDAAQTLGWQVERGLHEQIGLVVGVGTIVLLLLTGIVALAGGFS